MLDILHEQFEQYKKTPSALQLKAKMRKYLQSHKFHVIAVSSEYATCVVDFIRAYYPTQTQGELKRSLDIKYLDLYITNKAKTYPKLLHFSIMFYSNHLVKRDDLIKFFSNSLRSNIDTVPYAFPVVKDEYFQTVTPTTTSDTTNFFSSFDSVDVVPEKQEKVKSYLGQLSELSAEDFQHLFVLCPKDIYEEYLFTVLKEFLSQKSEIIEAVQQHVN